MNNSIIITNHTSQGVQDKKIFELKEEEMKDFKFLGQGCGVSVGHILFIGSKHNQNLRTDVVAYQIVESKYTKWLEIGMKDIGRNDKYLSVKFFGLK